MSGDARVYDYAHIHGNSKVIDSTEIFDFADIGGDTVISGNIRVYDIYFALLPEPPNGWHRHSRGHGLVENSATVSSGAYISRDARVSGNAQVSD